jgi:phage gpG-like protein
VNPEDYIRELIRKVPSIVKDAMDPQIIQTELAVDISDNMGDNVPNPVYPRPSGAKTLQLVTSKLFRAASVYKASGNVSKTTGSGTSFSFQWGIDLKVIPYARIHEFGGTINHPGGTPYYIKDGELRFVRKANGARFPKTKPHPIEIPARPYITPAMETFSGGNKTIDASGFTASPSGFARVINEIYLRLSLI